MNGSRSRVAAPWSRLLVALALSWVGSGAVAAELVIVTASETPIASLDRATARRLWLGETRRLGSLRVSVCDRIDPEIRDRFYEALLGKTHGQVKAIRTIRAFQDAMAPPPGFPSDASVLQWVLARPNRLGYVRAEAVTDAVKVLLEIGTPEPEVQP